MVEGLASALPTRIGRHDVVGFIATGGMAELYLGKDPTTGKPVVIKRILPHLARQSNFVSMFIDEARIGSLIKHANLVEIYELGQVGTDLFLVMEYLEGENLSGLIRRLVNRDEKLAYGLASYIVAQACVGLHAAHDLTDESGKPLKIVHRDVSPSNIFVTYDGEVKVLDFGIATAAHRLTQTATGQLKGKFSYMSPEQCRGEPLDARSDIFSLGVVLYELSMQKRLFKRSSELMVLKAVCEESIPRPSRDAPDYPPTLEKIVLRALSRERDRRYPTAKEMHGELIAAMSAMGLGADPRESLKYEMRRLFQERITEKHDLVRHVRAGTNIDHLPAAEVDESVDVPQVRPAAATTGSRNPDDATSTAQVRRSRRWIAFAVTLMLGGGVFAAWWYTQWEQKPPTPAPTPVAKAPADAAIADKVEPAPPPVPSEVVITVDSTPGGASVLIDDVVQGVTPLDVKLPRGNRAKVEVRKEGYVSLWQTIDADRDQRMLLALTKKKRTTSSRPDAKTDTKPPKKDDDGFHRFD